MFFLLLCDLLNGTLCLLRNPIAGDIKLEGRLYVIEFVKDKYERRICYEFIKIMGDNIIFPKGHITFETLHLSRNTLYVLDQKHQQALPLAPFLIFETCPRCHIHETFFLEITNKEESTYHTYRGNHRLKTDKYIQSFRIDG